VSAGAFITPEGISSLLRKEDVPHFDVAHLEVPHLVCQCVAGVRAAERQDVHGKAAIAVGRAHGQDAASPAAPKAADCLVLPGEAPRQTRANVRRRFEQGAGLRQNQRRHLDGAGTGQGSMEGHPTGHPRTRPSSNATPCACGEVRVQTPPPTSTIAASAAAAAAAAANQFSLVKQVLD
jgi:hypothetical protein